MALLVLEFGGAHPAGELIGDRVLDTVLGAVAGFLAAVLVTNRRATGRVERALDAAERARAEAERTCADPASAPADRDRARRTLTAGLVELREAGDTAAGEWWQRALPEQRLLAVERAGHRTLAATAHRRGSVDGTTSTATPLRTERRDRRHRCLGGPAVAGRPPRARHRAMEIIGRINRCAALLQQAEDAPLRSAGLTRAEFDLLGAVRRTDRELTPANWPARPSPRAPPSPSGCGHSRSAAWSTAGATTATAGSPTSA